MDRLKTCGIAHFVNLGSHFHLCGNIDLDQFMSFFFAYYESFGSIANTGTCFQVFDNLESRCAGCPNNVAAAASGCCDSAVNRKRGETRL
jgi:hypothetical protein